MHKNKTNLDRMPMMSELVARRDVGTYTNGAISPKTLANLDSLGIGPERKWYINGYVFYEKHEVGEIVRQRIGRQRGRKPRKDQRLSA